MPTIIEEIDLRATPEPAAPATPAEPAAARPLDPWRLAAALRRAEQRAARLRAD